jgi:hypothetical protein
MTQDHSSNRCRSQIANPDRRYCRQHILTQESKGDFELLLTDQALRFRKARGIHNSLQRLYVLLAAGQISPRRAATLTYISNLLILMPSRPIPGPAAAPAPPCPARSLPRPQLRPGP